MTGAAVARAGVGQGLRLAGAALVLHLVLILPNHPGAMTPGALILFPLELPVILLVLMAVPCGRAQALLRGGLAAFLLLLTVQKLGDAAMFTAFNRGFNLMVDLPLAVAGWRLGSGAVGIPLAALAVVAGLAALSGAGWLIGWALAVWGRVAPRPALRRTVALGAGLAAMLALAEIGQAMRAWALPATPPGAAFTARVAVERVGLYRRTLADLADFRHAAATDPLADRAGLMDLLAGRDVLVIFVESYGRASLDNPLYAPTHRATLAQAGADLAAAGLETRSGSLRSPIVGGQSWLAHATFAAGLGVGNQTRHGALLASDRLTLWQIARDAGYHTLAVMPAITLPWPERARLGFDTLLDRDAMGYAGRPFNWVTMPDQFTLARFRDRLPPAAPRPIFAQIALISSHAPWVPVPQMIPWEEVGDGRAFDAMAATGDAPEVVWRDPDRVRDQYRQALDYALQSVFGFAAQEAALRGAEAPLLVVLGDHPAAAFVAQTGGDHVPLHLIGPPEALAPFDSWGLAPGLLPGPEAPVRPMEEFRDLFVAATASAPALQAGRLP
ncbi:MAG: sulfatase-like hydrolase/transferase [Gemmobacter sp.]